MTTPENVVVDGRMYAINHGLDEPAATALALHATERLGYVAASQEWTDGWEPLPDEIQAAADELVRAGMLPEFEEWFQ